jgi:hypothetical protein
MLLRIKVPIHEADYLNRSGFYCKTESICISSAPFAFVSFTDTDAPRVSDRTGNRNDWFMLRTVIISKTEVHRNKWNRAMRISDG